MSVNLTKSRMVLRAGDVDEAPGTAYLLVVENESSSIVDLPRTGAVVIGRAPEAGVQLLHPSVSRRHATIQIEDGVLRIADLGSRNGTRVNGELIAQWRTLGSGDVASVGDITLVVHVSKPAAIPRSIYQEMGWRRRLVEEIERAMTFKRSLAVAAVLTTDPAAGAALVHHLRLIDVVGRGDDGQILLLLPEVDRDEARALLRGGLAATSRCSDARAGQAVCPADAVDADTILMAARIAASRAEPGMIADAAESAAFRPISEELEQLERRRMSQALAATNHVKAQAAQLINMPIRTFTLKLKQYGL